MQTVRYSKHPEKILAFVGDVGEARLMLSIYRHYVERHGFYPCFVDWPKINRERRYAVKISWRTYRVQWWRIDKVYKVRPFNSELKRTSKPPKHSNNLWWRDEIVKNEKGEYIII